MAEIFELDDELDSLLGDFHPLISEADFDALLTLDLGITGAIAEPEPDEPEPIVQQKIERSPLRELTVKENSRKSANKGNSSEEEGSPKPLQRKRKSRLSVHAGPQKQRRFAGLTSSPELRKAQRGYVSKNTDKSTAWALKNFRDWRIARNEEAQAFDPPRKLCPENILETVDSAELEEWLCLYISETRQSNGERFPPSSLSALLSGISRQIQKCNPKGFNIMDTKDQLFQRLHAVRDTVYHALHKEGVGTTREQARIITYEEKEQLWVLGILGTHTPQALLNAVFYYNGLHFALRGGQEHRELKRSQLAYKQLPNPSNPAEKVECFVYTEHGSKNRSGTVSQQYVPNKVVTQYANPAVGDRCHVELLKLYIGKLLPDTEMFYYRASQKKNLGPHDPWYSAQLIGHNTLGKMLKMMFMSAGLDSGGITNHSLRATAATRLLEHGVADKSIQNRTGHRSVQGLQAYQRSTPLEVQKVSTLLTKPVLNKSADLERDSIPKHIKPEVEPVASKPSMDDIARQFNFANMHGCTMNIHINK